jgi:type IV secretion system protein VirB6
MSLSACAPVATGNGFLKSSLVYLDCAGRAIGSAGYTALAQPGSIVSQLILTAVTLFIAWHGIRLMSGQRPDVGEAVIAVAKIGLVLMLVASWPAVRTLVAEPSFSGPGELVRQTGIPGPTPLEDRLQRTDDGIVALTKWGTGKLDIRAGRTADGQPAASEFSGIALTDNLALGLGRLCFLVGTLLSIGLLKLLTGVMITALPIFAGLLLFETTRGIFVGWLRLIFALFVASIAIPLILTVELSLLEPWLARAIEQRTAYLATPSAPTELLAIASSFLLVLIGTLALVTKACFAIDLTGFAVRIGNSRAAGAGAEEPSTLREFQPASAGRKVSISRAETLAMTLARIEHGSRGSPLAGGRLSKRSADIDQGDFDYHSAGRPARRRAKHRVSLSHARRNLL